MFFQSKSSEFSVHTNTWSRRFSVFGRLPTIYNWRLEGKLFTLNFSRISLIWRQVVSDLGSSWNWKKDVTLSRRIKFNFLSSQKKPTLKGRETSVNLYTHSHWRAKSFIFLHVPIKSAINPRLKVVAELVKNENLSHRSHVDIFQRPKRKLKGKSFSLRNVSACTEEWECVVCLSRTCWPETIDINDRLRRGIRNEPIIFRQFCGLAVWRSSKYFAPDSHFKIFSGKIFASADCFRSFYDLQNFHFVV